MLEHAFVKKLPAFVMMRGQETYILTASKILVMTRSRVYIQVLIFELQVGEAAVCTFSFSFELQVGGAAAECTIKLLSLNPSGWSQLH